MAYLDKNEIISAMKEPCLLFLHGNFPGQFLDIAPFLAAKLAARVVFLTMSDNPQGIHLPGVEYQRFERHRESGKETHHYLKSVEAAVLNGQAVVRQLITLRSQGFVPDVVVSHCGFGYAAYVKNIFPESKLISYVEWYFTDKNASCLNPDISVDELMRLNAFNIPCQQESLQADVLVCPTRWQASQFPVELQSKIQCIFDGVSTTLFPEGSCREPLEIVGRDSSSPLIIDPEALLLTYGTRGMEPLRGFSEFMRAASVAMEAFKDLQVVVFGADRVAYGMTADKCSHPSGSWKDQMLQELMGSLDLDRLHFTGLINYGILSKLFRRSDLHCYFTRPYVVSWGVFQAAASGSPLLMNQFPGVEEVLEGPPEFPYVDLDSQQSVNQGVVNALEKVRSLGNARDHGSRLSLGLDSSSCLMQWLHLINELLSQ
ncbi:MAG: hypothetical protein GKR83_05610 [Synechococcus sp. s2_metabat2_7]|nr:hypothetical protein [Synechococcus sp. s2_metabat2_7]